MLLQFCKCYSQPSHVVSYNYFSFSAQYFISCRVRNWLALCFISFLCAYSLPPSCDLLNAVRGAGSSISLVSLKATLQSSDSPIRAAHFLRLLHGCLAPPFIGHLANPISSFFCLLLSFVEHILYNFLKKNT